MRTVLVLQMIVMITWALKADNYLLSTLVVGKVKKVCNYEKQCTLFPLMLTTTIQQYLISNVTSNNITYYIDIHNVAQQQ